MADPHETSGAPPTHVHVERKRQPGWFKALAWLALLAGILALLFGLSRCDPDEQVAGVPAVTTVPTQGDSSVVAATPNADAATALAGTSGLGTYLAGDDPAPRSFQFEKLNFDTAGSDVRSSDRAEIDRIAGVLKQYGDARVRIAGYADARGSSAANDALGRARANAVKAALVAQGIDAARIETASGGESDPVANNTTTSGQAENRRTELVVVAR